MAACILYFREEKLPKGEEDERRDERRDAQHTGFKLREQEYGLLGVMREKKDNT